MHLSAHQPAVRELFAANASMRFSLTLLTIPVVFDSYSGDFSALTEFHLYCTPFSARKESNCKYPNMVIFVIQKKIQESIGKFWRMCNQKAADSDDIGRAPPENVVRFFDQRSFPSE